MFIFRYILLLLICWQAAVSGVLSVDDLIANAREKKSEEVEQPQNPADLTPTWWDYYGGAGEDLEKRIEASKAYFLHLQETASPDNREEINGYIQKILINLGALPTLRAQKATTYQPTPFLDHYSFDKLLEIVSRKKQLETIVADESKELQQDQERAKKVKQHIDVLMAGYLDMKAKNVQKELAGLEMMSLRIALAITEEKIRLWGEKKAQYLNEISQLKNEITYAQAHLNVGSIDSKQLEKEIESAQNDLKSAQDIALNSEMSSMGIVGDDPIERAVNFLHSQRSVLDNVKAAIAQTNVIFYLAKQSLVQVLEKHPEVNEKELLANLSFWEEDLNLISEQLEDWTSKTQQENDRLLQPLSLLEGAPAEVIKERENIQLARTKNVQESTEALNQLKIKLNFDNLLIADINDKALKDGSTFGWFYAILGVVQDCCEPIYSWLNNPLIKIGGVPLTVISLLRIILIIGLTYGLSRLVRHFLKRINKSNMHMTEASVFIIDRLVHYIILILGFALALSSIGLNLSSLAIVLGALSVGIGFGLQNIVNNFFSSLIIMFSRTLKVGDMIEITDKSYGQVAAINVQNTVIHTKDGIDVVIPNSEILSHRLVNWTLNDNFRRLHIPFSVANGMDKDLVVQAATEAAQNVPCTVMNTATKDPQVWLVGFGDTGTNYELVVWVNVYGFGHKGSMNASYLWELDNAFSKYKISTPCPQLQITGFTSDSINFSSFAIPNPAAAAPAPAITTPKQEADGINIAS